MSAWQAAEPVPVGIYYDVPVYDSDDAPVVDFSEAEPQRLSFSGKMPRRVAVERFDLSAFALAPQRLTHRKTTDGRLCSAEYTQGGVTYSDCTTAPNPDAVAGKEWCAVEPGLAGSDWSYCAPKVDYGAMRSVVEVGFAAKAEEAHRSIMSVQQLSRNIKAEIDRYREACE